jgi:hypothetical protein
LDRTADESAFNVQISEVAIDFVSRGIAFKGFFKGSNGLKSGTFGPKG